MNRPFVTDTDCLFAWTSHRDRRTQREVVGLLKVAAFDEHGCRFESRWSQDAAMISDVSGHLFTGFPRRGKTVHLTVFDVSDHPLTDFEFPNPAPTLYPLWTPEPLPITKQAGDLSITLTDLHTDPSPSGKAPNEFRFYPGFQFSQNGKPSDVWQADYPFSVSDATGNELREDIYNLCPYEPAWKLHMKFFLKDTASFSLRETWTVNSVQMPEPGKGYSLSAANTLNGVALEVKGIAGPGTFSYPNGIRKYLGKRDSKDGGGFSVGSSGNGAQTVETLSAPSPYVEVNVTGLTIDKRLTLWATDAKGRRYNMSYNSAHYFCLAIPPDVKSVDLHFVVHSARTAEFLIKPPLPPGKTGK
jgi:hypothetical protein